jgi:hypothetical protein
VASSLIFCTFWTSQRLPLPRFPGQRLASTGNFGWPDLTECEPFFHPWKDRGSGCQQFRQGRVSPSVADRGAWS